MTNSKKTALLALEDGTVFWSTSIGAEGETFGEFVFNTGMTGYQEVLTDPSYCGQIVVMTYPEIGIYGVNPEDVESGKVQVAGFVVHRAARGSYNQRANVSFLDYLTQANIVAIEGVDTRALTRHLRTHGAQRGAISTTDLEPESLIARVRKSPQMAGSNLAQFVTTERVASCELRVKSSESASDELRIVVIDCGRKENIVRDLQAHGAAVTVVPYDADLDTVLALKPDGVMVSNGPGDPEPLEPTIALIQGLLKARIPLSGICLGHQLLGLALGGVTYKMRFGHRGANHPVKDFATGRVLITTQNHGFAVDPTSLGIAWGPLDAAFTAARPELLSQKSKVESQKSSVTMAELLPEETLVGESPAGFGAIEVTQISLNDGTMEGIILRDYPAFSVQYHPEACPGPHDAAGFFDQFVSLIAQNQTSAS